MEKLIMLLCDSIEVLCPLLTMVLIIRLINGILNIWDYIQIKYMSKDIQNELKYYSISNGKHAKEE